MAKVWKSLEIVLDEDDPVFRVGDGPDERCNVVAVAWDERSPKIVVLTYKKGDWIEKGQAPLRHIPRWLQTMVQQARS